MATASLASAKRRRPMPAWLRVVLCMVAGLGGSIGLMVVLRQWEVLPDVANVLAWPLIYGVYLACGALGFGCHDLGGPEAWVVGFIVQALVWGGAVTLVVELFRRRRIKCERA